MARHRVIWTAKIFAEQIVEIDDGYLLDPTELSFRDGFPQICAQCTGYPYDKYNLEFPEDPAQWEWVDTELLED